ncbi:MAG TPA: metalloregulator ArsR/SmtB family transcription factor [Candidatus Luteococcus avicola]|nr:metalloregulator ArsR/SmtB family transcription factor [Candidatus Luteococcus avicola]
MTERILVANLTDECCPPSEASLPVERAQQIAVVARALCDPVRLRIFHHIAASRCSSACACHLPEVFGVSQPTLSHHLKKLVDAGLVDREMRGRWAHYSPRPEGLATLRALLTEVP